MKEIYISSENWDEIVINTYNKYYEFQQQEGCKDKGTFKLEVPSKYTRDNEMHNSIPEVVNGELMGVKFDIWLKRDINQGLENKKDFIDLFWCRNFYPDIYTLANDLYKRGIIEEGIYIIGIE